jgi:hypothetical protein
MSPPTWLVPGPQHGCLPSFDATLGFQEPHPRTRASARTSRYRDGIESHPGPSQELHGGRVQLDGANAVCFAHVVASSKIKKTSPHFLGGFTTTIPDGSNGEPFSILADR